MRILTQEEHHERLINNMAMIMYKSHKRGNAYKRELVMELFLGTNLQNEYVKLYVKELCLEINGKL
ncbi:hypothetical protein FOI42_RS03185 [Escherichia coli]|nr:hypothetical protein [Escherichia coli]EFL4883371.1 hypothetical protein [Escherichia coli]MED6699313.1 hypothetical protein [Escherichia coli O157]USL83393.1 hypothetical protein A4_317 [Escherichia phage A4]HCQ0858673.1 hypothetical protein [Escherichia coli]